MATSGAAFLMGTTKRSRGRVHSTFVIHGRNLYQNIRGILTGINTKAEGGVGSGGKALVLSFTVTLYPAIKPSHPCHTNAG